ncbi:MAG: DUF4131 domain-containing protein, partial [Alphaproteobacteria bacterium]
MGRGDSLPYPPDESKSSGGIRGKKLSSGENAGASGAARVVGEAILSSIRLSLWLPVAFGAGIAMYFALPVELPLVVGVVAVAGTALLALTARSTVAGPLLVLCSGAAAGFLAGQLRTHQVDAPILEKRLGPVTVEGRVIRWEEEQQGFGRLILGALTVERLGKEHTPARVRLIVRTGGDKPWPGDRVRLRAILEPPPTPSFPGDFDFARKLYFERIGALGFAISPVQRISGDAGAGAAAKIESLRALI